MSKRSGEFVSLDELVDDIGVDAARWFMLWRSHDTTVDLDLELARRESSDNPVYYVQYAHARIASILRKAEGEGAAAPDAPAGAVPGHAARAGREGADQAAARVPRRGPRGGRAPRAAPDLRLLDRGRRRLPRLLPRLPGGRRRGGGGRARAPGALPADEADDRRLARPARDLRSRADVMLGRARDPPVAGPPDAACAAGDAAPRATSTRCWRCGRRSARAWCWSPGERGALRVGGRAWRRAAAAAGRKRRCSSATSPHPRLADALGLDPEPGLARVPARRGRGAGDPAAAGPRRAGLAPRRGAAGLHRRRRARPRSAPSCSPPRASATRSRNCAPPTTLVVLDGPPLDDERRPAGRRRPGGPASLALRRRKSRVAARPDGASSTGPVVEADPPRGRSGRGRRRGARRPRRSGRGGAVAAAPRAPGPRRQRQTLKASATAAQRRRRSPAPGRRRGRSR